MDFQKKLSKLLGNDKTFDEVQIDKRVIEEVVKIAREADPKEYVALLSGKINKKILKITGLIFLPFKASETSAVMEVFMMPITTDAVGSIHSHPGPSNRPSDADRIFFGKNGYFHLIICRPYTEATIASYDAFGNPIDYKVVDLGEEVELKQWDELDIDKELFDDELLAELERLEHEEDSDESNDEDSLDNIDSSDNDDSFDSQKSMDIPDEISDNEFDSTHNDYVPSADENNDNKPKSNYYINSTGLSRKNLVLKNKNNAEQKPMDKKDNSKKAEPKDAEIVDPKVPKWVNINIESQGKVIEKQLPVPPEYEVGDDLIVDVRTDRTPGDNIDEIILKVQKSPKNLAKQQQLETSTGKSSEELDDEIKQMEEDIKRLKEENERLRNDQ